VALLAGWLVVPLGLIAIQIVVYVAVAVVVFGAYFSATGWLLAAPLLALTVMTFCALGVFSASFIVLTKRGDPFSFFVAQGSTFLAGAVFPPSLLPGPLRTFTHLVPAYYGLNGAREALLGGGGFSAVAGEVGVLALFSAVVVPLSVLCFARALRAARVTGTLGNY